MLRHIVLAVLLLALAPLTTWAQSETRPGQIDVDKVVQHVSGMPQRGTDMSHVRADLGEPNHRLGPVGEPPITRWVYDRFTVYFERNLVLHAVKNSKN